MPSLLLPSLLAFGVTALAGAPSAQAQGAAPATAARFGAPLSCQGVAAKTAAPTLALTKAATFVVDPKAEAWGTAAMKQVGFPARYPTAPGARAAALQATTLAMRGNIVAAKMANDEATATVSGYPQSPFAASFEAFLTASTQPVRHASYPSAVLAEGETQRPHSAGTFGVDLEQASASLAEVIRRAGLAKTAMGAAYGQPAVRFYLLAHGFRDEVALQSATTSVCALGLSDDVRKKLDISARFMAMPAASGTEDVGSGAPR